MFQADTDRVMSAVSSLRARWPAKDYGPAGTRSGLIKKPPKPPKPSSSQKPGKKGGRPDPH